MTLCIDKICRTCMSMTETGLLSIYEKCLQQKELSDNMPSITEMLMSFTTIQVEKDDGLPEHICLTCISDINSAFAFKQKCERAEITLKTYLQQLNVSNNIKQESSVTTLPDLGEITHLLKTEEMLLENNQLIEANRRRRAVAAATTLTKTEIVIVNDNENFIIENKTELNIEEENNVDNLAGVEQEDEDEEDEDDQNHELMESIDEENDDIKTEENIIYECVLCCSRFEDKSNLKDHMINFHDTKHCIECDMYFKTIELYNEHIDENHLNESIVTTTNEIETKEKNNKISKQKIVHKCSYCGMDFVHKRNFEKHLIRYHSSDIKLKNLPNINKKQLIEDDNISLAELKNLTTKTDSKIVSLTEKPTSPSSTSSTTTITTTLNPVTHYKCSKCGARFVKEKSLRLHHNSNKCTELSYPCSICKRVFARKKNLQQHMLLHDDKKDYKCNECPKEFTRQDQLTLHMQNHRGIKKHQCGFCCKGFNMISTLKDHIRTHNGERPFLCSICGKGFSQSTNLKQHIMRHTKTKPFKCTICLYAFVSKGELDAHLRKHTGDHPFVCDVCGTGFTTSSSLVKHKRIHTGEKPYACEFCPMRFTALGTLKNHRRTHTGERPFACKFCERTFAQKSDMVSHTRTHTGERPYVCSLCHLAFQHSSTLKSHYKIHQNQDEEQQTGSVVDDIVETSQKDILNTNN